MRKYLHIKPTMSHHVSDKQRMTIYLAMLVDIGTIHILFNIIGKQ